MHVEFMRKNRIREKNSCRIERDELNGLLLNMKIDLENVQISRDT